MKIIKIIIYFFLLETGFLFAQESTTAEIKNKDVNTPQMLGCITRNDFLKTPFDEWYLPNYNSYIVDSAKLKEINSDSIALCSITIVFGSWCPDSRAEVPGFLKVCDYLNIDTDNIKLIAVDRSKDVNAVCAQNEDVQFVPTYFFYYQGVLIGKVDDHSGIEFEELFRSFF